MLQGKAILDGGATRTLGSVAAVERLMELNQQRKGDTGLRHVDSEQRPVFGFGTPVPIAACQRHGCMWKPGVGW